MKTFVLMALVLPFAGCAGHKVLHDAPDESQPHVTWELRAGGEDGEGRLVCISSQAEPTCGLIAGELATAHLYMHPAREVSTYEGTLRLPFLGETQATAERKISATVRPGNLPENVTVVGAVTKKADIYTMTVSLKSTLGGRPAPQISHEARIVVR